eukprot:CAMPEP_0171854202 /NCGR_PEP_ID=MMETSP0992-20121227/22735_1 /TAXON_ID=483369 /ORGANISM="non described non described, Strain CCMP2098" /LENGTH=76 /DNA_ID=CAMNT_0012474765 /DNA_START=65 /DNA_END=296 /DNA_ORIENTATION=-
MARVPYKFLEFEFEYQKSRKKEWQSASQRAWRDGAHALQPPLLNGKLLRAHGTLAGGLSESRGVGFGGVRQGMQRV